MFIVSVKPTKKKIIIISAIVVAVILMIMRVSSCSAQSAAATGKNGTYSLLAEGNAGRIEFLEQFGWKTAGKASETEEITIPSEFNETYTSYNELQKQQGLDLTKYKGEKCKKYVYKILNYDGDSEVVATLLILNNKVIGGDISETKKDGFMQTFYMEGEEKTPELSSKAESSENSENSSKYSDDEVSSTLRETLAPDPEMPEAPTD